MRFWRNMMAALIGFVLLAIPVSAAAGGNHRFDRDDWSYGNPPPGRGWHNGWYKHHRFEADDDDGDFRAPPPIRYAHREPDRDDLSEGGYQGGTPYYGYYQSQASGLLAQRQRWEITRNSAMAQYYAALRRGDHKSAQHLMNAARAADKQLSLVNGQLQAVGSMPASYMPPAAPYAAYPYNGAYNNYYGNSYYGNSLGVLSSLVGPMLGVVP